MQEDLIGLFGGMICPSNISWNIPNCITPDTIMLNCETFSNFDLNKEIMEFCFHPICQIQHSLLLSKHKMDKWKNEKLMTSRLCFQISVSCLRVKVDSQLFFITISRYKSQMVEGKIQLKIDKRKYIMGHH